MIEMKMMPIRMAPRTRNMVRIVMMSKPKIPIQSVGDSIVWPVHAPVVGSLY